MKLNWINYLDINPDLRKNGIVTEQQAIDHWNQYGKLEGRTYFFDWQYYLDSYPDLRQNGIITEQQAIDHWNKHGKKEERTHFFDWINYLDFNPDLRQNGIHTEEQAKQHWNTYGKQEGRVLYCNLDWEFYIDKYPDLRESIVTEQQAIDHWNKYGKQEGRQSFGTKCGIAISTYHRNSDRIESFKQCIGSIMKYKKEDTIVIVVDDGSLINDHIIWMKEIFPMITIEKKQNGGIAKCKNTCLRVLTEFNVDVYFLLDDDVEILQSFEEKYIESLKEVHILSGHSQESGNNHFSYTKNTCKTDKLNGFLLCFIKKTFLKSGYFRVPEGKWGMEHCWYTKRVMKCTNTTNYFDVNSFDLYKLIDCDSTLTSIEKETELKKNVNMMNNYVYYPCIE